MKKHRLFAPPEEKPESYPSYLGFLFSVPETFLNFLYYNISLFMEGAGYSQAGHRFLARKLDVHPQTIARSLKNLQEAGYISITRIGLLIEVVRNPTIFRKPL